METYSILRDLAIIFICAKGAGLLARKCRAPMVVGEIIAGLIIGPCLLNWVTPNDFVAKMAEIGVWNCQEMCSQRIPKILDRQESGGVMSQPS